jgi:hypothetical protein
MTNWKYHVYLYDLHDKYEDIDPCDFDYKDIIGTLLTRMELLKEAIIECEDADDANAMLSGFNGLNNIISDLKYFTYGYDTDEMEDQYHNIMTDIYDYADDYSIWINTFDKNLNGIGKPVN